MSKRSTEIGHGRLCTSECSLRQQRYAGLICSEGYGACISELVQQHDFSRAG